VEVVVSKEITKIKEEEAEETEIEEVEKVADQALVATDQQKGLEEISQQKDFDTISPQIDLEEVDIQKDLGLEISRVLKSINPEKAEKKTTEEKVIEKSQNFLTKNLEISKIEILIQVIKKIIKIKNLLIKKNI
jgi:hypothetical protein